MTETIVDLYGGHRFEAQLLQKEYVESGKD